MSEELRRTVGQTTREVDDLAGRGYWNSLWSERESQREVNPKGRDLRNHLRRKFHLFFCESLGDGNGKRLVEVGCADSVWLPYFGKTLGFSVAGLDYSETGCEKARLLLRRAGVNGRVYQADLFDPPFELLGASDAAFSYGLIEHFTDTAGALRAMAALLKQGGVLITIIPNMAFVNGALQRLLCRRVYDLHVPLRLQALIEAHDAAGLSVLAGRHLMSVNFGMLVAGSTGVRSIGSTIKRGIRYALIGCQLPLWWLESRNVHLLPPNRWTSPYLAVVARRR